MYPLCLLAEYVGVTDVSVWQYLRCGQSNLAGIVTLLNNLFQEVKVLLHLVLWHAEQIHGKVAASMPCNPVRKFANV
jgi:hypothetical protein